MSEVNCQNEPVEQHPAEPKPLEQTETPNTPERSVLIFDDHDGAHGLSDVNDPSVGGFLS